MVLQAKDALGRVPGLNDDLPDVKKNYLDKGDMFWLAIDDNDRVIGSIGYNSLPDSSETVLHRLFVKYDKKRCGIGSALLNTAEKHMRKNGKTICNVHLGIPKEQWLESYSFYPAHGYKDNGDGTMSKVLIHQE